MAPKVWAVGDVLSAADLNAWASPLAGIKSANQTIISQTTFVNDADLRFAMAANAAYEFKAFLRYSSGTGQDIKFSFTVPAGADCRYMYMRNNISTGTFAGNGEFGAADTATAQGNGVGTVVAAHCTGIALTAGTAGNLILQWAQNVSGAFNTTMYANSYLTGRRIS
jgi:hypothetical protein